MALPCIKTCQKHVTCHVALAPWPSNTRGGHVVLFLPVSLYNKRISILVFLIVHLNHCTFLVAMVFA